jgi:hypothetical protein
MATQHTLPLEAIEALRAVKQARLDAEGQLIEATILMELARTAVERTQREYDEAVKRLSTELVS